MDSNKDDAEKCITIAEQAFKSQNFEKAEKFLEKAERLFPSTRAKGLLQKLATMNKENLAGDQEENTPNDGSTETDGPELRNRARTRSSSRSRRQEQTHSAGEYTKEQLDAVKRIKACKNYYEILGIAKDGTDSDLKKAYRKLALQFHPDKNKTPGASEAFKAIGNAFATLSDAEKRKKYDLYGSDDDQMERRSNYRTASHGHQDHRGFESDINAEELFNMFFGGGFPGQTIYTRRGNRWETYASTSSRHTDSTSYSRQNASNWGLILQLLPFLILVTLSLLGNFLASDPVYSYQRSSKYPMERHTSNLRVPFYVRETFDKEYHGEPLKRLERSIEEDYISTVRHSCYREKQYKENMLWKARSYGDTRLFEKARNYPTPNCELLQTLYASTAA